MELRDEMQIRFLKNIIVVRSLHYSGRYVCSSSCFTEIILNASYGTILLNPYKDRIGFDKLPCLDVQTNFKIADFANS